MREVEEVEPLPIKTQHHAHNFYRAFAFKPSVLAFPASASSILDRPARKRFYSVNGEE